MCWGGSHCCLQLHGTNFQQRVRAPPLVNGQNNYNEEGRGDTNKKQPLKPRTLWMFRSLCALFGSFKSLVLCFRRVKHASGKPPHTNAVFHLQRTALAGTRFASQSLTPTTELRSSALRSTNPKGCASSVRGSDLGFTFINRHFDTECKVSAVCTCDIGYFLKKP